MIGKAELEQLIDWLADIEQSIDYIEENAEEEPFRIMDECKKVRGILTKIRGMLTVIK